VGNLWTITVACAVCGTQVSVEVRPGQSLRRYCSKTCKRRAARRRNKARRQLEKLPERVNQAGPLCPTPFKRTYRTWDEAQHAVASFRPPDPQLTAYRCVCGAIHLGH